MVNAINLKDDSSNFEEQYCDMLDDMGTVHIGMLEYQRSVVLRLVDEVAYRCGLNDYADSCDDERECGNCGARFFDEDDADECCKDVLDIKDIEGE